MDYWAQEKAIIEDDLSECEAILNELRVEADMGCEVSLDGLEKIKIVRKENEAYNWHPNRQIEDGWCQSGEEEFEENKVRANVLLD